MVVAVLSVVVVPQDEISTIIKSYGNCQLVRGKCLNGGGIVAPAPSTGRVLVVVVDQWRVLKEDIW